MRNRNQLQRAAMAALVAAALSASVGQASASVYRFPDSPPSRLLEGRAKRLDDGSGGIGGRVRLMLASVRIFRDGGWEGIQGQRVPARIVRRSD